MAKKRRLIGDELAAELGITDDNDREGAEEILNMVLQFGQTLRLTFFCALVDDEPRRSAAIRQADAAWVDFGTEILRVAARNRD